MRWISAAELLGESDALFLTEQKNGEKNSGSSSLFNTAVSPSFKPYDATNLVYTTLNNSYKFVSGGLGSVEAGQRFEKANTRNYIVADVRFTTTDELKQFLAEQYAAGTPVYFDYVLETPIVEQLSAEDAVKLQALHTYATACSFTNSDEAYLKVTYVADTKVYIDNKFSELSTAILAIGGA